VPAADEKITGENTWLEKGFAMTDSLLQWCAANKIYLILDLHAAPGGQGNDLNISDRDRPRHPFGKASNRNKMIALGKAGAALFQRTLDRRLRHHQRTQLGI